MMETKEDSKLMTFNPMLMHQITWKILNEKFKTVCDNVIHKIANGIFDVDEVYIEMEITRRKVVEVHLQPRIN